MEVSRYTADDRAVWNDFVRASRNGTFLFQREYMEYHAGRFHDWSLVFRNARGQIAAVLPASRSEGTVTSHAGLTYGGLVYGDALTTSEVEVAFSGAVESLAAAGIAELVYKCVPHIYHRSPAEEDRYALFVRGAELVRRDVLAVIDYRARPALKEMRKRSVRKASRAGLTVTESADYQAFWRILTQTLGDRYGVAPVHSLDEIRLLASRFPENIRLFTAMLDGETLAGVVLYLTPFVGHVQYCAGSASGKQTGALDLLLETLVEQFSGAVRYFDFGISNEHDGRYLNAGLVEYKEAFGARAVAHDFYRLPIGERP